VSREKLNGSGTDLLNQCKTRLAFRELILPDTRIVTVRLKVCAGGLAYGPKPQRLPDQFPTATFRLVQGSE
jgi:hypothetical protein